MGGGLIALDVLIDSSDEDVRSDESDRPGEDEESSAEHAHVAEVERGLHDTGHARLREEVVDRVEVDVQRRRPTAGEGSPVPAVILRREKHVGRHDRHADGDDDENELDQEHETVAAQAERQKEHGQRVRRTSEHPASARARVPLTHSRTYSARSW